MRARLAKRALAVPLALAALTGLPTAAGAQTGGVGPDQPSTTPTASPGGATGGVQYGQRPPTPAAKPKPKPKPKPPSGPRIVSLAVSPGIAYSDGPRAQVRFVVRGGVQPVRVTLLVVRRGTTAPALRLDLGAQPRGRVVTVRWSPGSMRGGSYVVRLLARDRRGARSRVGRTSAATSLTVHDARFPVAGPHSFGNADNRYGAPRAGHTHAGQDILADEGTPLVAVRGGTVISTGSGGAAGNYVTLHGNGTGRDYFYAHLRSGTTLVSEGQHVLTGQVIGQVGQTGDATAPHLHFEIWEGGWWAGGHTIDPLPDLLRWDAWS
jgi:murein DD-endopeptidase MepM/ murein hydrolase activator NlpD